MAISYDIKSKLGSTKRKIRKGRGHSSGYGCQAGRGHKGQKSRSGYSRRAGFEGGQNPLYRRLPKKRGINNNCIFKYSFTPINFDVLERFYQLNEIVSLATLIKKKLIKSNEIPKILGKGVLSKKLIIQDLNISNSAKKKLEILNV
jgi:large subunit ribosomal protein L15